jgi:putative endonuclease
MEAHVYILKSMKNGRYYVGSTNNLERRLVQHNSRQVPATKHICPLEMVFHQIFDSEMAAKKMEYRLKQYKSRKILDQIVTDGKIKVGV